MFQLGSDQILTHRYGPAARRLDEYLRKLLHMAGIQALFSNRVKQLESLNEKLKKPKYDKFETIDDVVAGIKDLAGVRVGLYYPSDKWEVEALLYECFGGITQTTHPTQDEDELVSSAARFAGYSAEHYNIPISAVVALPDIFVLSHSTELSNWQRSVKRCERLRMA